MSLLNLVFLIIALAVLYPIAKALDRVSKASSPLIAALIFAVLVVSLVMLRRYAGKALFPKCKNGTCGPRDYEGVPVRPGDAGLTFKCKCGQRYLRKRNRFLILGEDGQAIPYKIKRHFYSLWTDDA